MHKWNFLDFSVDKGRAVKSYPQVINMKKSPKIPINQIIFESGLCFINISTGHTTNTTNFLKRRKELLSNPNALTGSAKPPSQGANGFSINVVERALALLKEKGEK